VTAKEQLHEAALQDAAQAQDEAADSAGRLERRSFGLSSGLGALGTKMSSLPGPLGSVGSGLSSMSEKFSQVDASSSGLSNAHEKLKVLAAGAATAAAGVATALYKIGSAFDDVSASIVVGTGASGEQLDELMDIATDIGTTIPVSFAEAGDAVATLNTAAGESGQSLRDLSEQVLNASRLLGEDAATNA